MLKTKSLRPSQLAAAAALAAATSYAAAQAPSPAGEAGVVVITGNPLASPRTAAPVSVLAGDALVLRRGATLGDTLDGLPGVSSTYFGPHANRPVVRGLDGDRVRVLANGGASVDASALSFDHAVPIDPLFVTRIEVLRGPGALLYGGSAIGGVVQPLDNRIPGEPVRGVQGAAELRLGGAAGERGGAAQLEGGSGRFAWHVDAFTRRSHDLRVPLFTPVAEGEAQAPTRRVLNSASDTQGGAVGGSWFFDGGRLGVSLDGHDSRYGIVAEPDITIDLQREHLGLAGELARPLPGLAELRWRANRSVYRHLEIEGDGEVGTTFDSRGSDLRLEVTHLPVGPWRGVIGLQWEDSTLSALGEEAFVPSTHTRKAAIFAMEELAWTGGTSSIGLRLERASVDSNGDADPAEPRFGAPQQRRFSLRSLALGHVQPLAPGWSWSANVSANERAPTYFELYANGLHVATGQYERGDPTLVVERGVHVEAGVQWRHGAHRLQAQVYGTRFSRFISLEATGDRVDESGAAAPPDADEAWPLLAFRAVRARMHGLELEAATRLADRPWTLDASARLDLTRATNLDTGEALPRIAPARLRLALEASQGPWRATVEWDAAARQDRVPATDRATAGYALLHLGVSRRVRWGEVDALWFARVQNAGDRLAYSAVSADTVRSLSPLPGRAFSTGLRVEF